MKRTKIYFTIWTVSLSLMCISVTAQEGQALYNVYASRVVYLQHELYVDGGKTEYPSLWKRFEEYTESDFLSAYISVFSGSGFFIDHDGHILTNSHVVEFESLDELRKAAINGISNTLDSMTLQYTPKEVTQMKRDLETLFNNSEYRFSAMNGNEYLGTVDVLAKGDPEENDIALVIVKDTKSEPLSLATVKDIEDTLTGLDVYSMGYPLGDSLDYLNKQRVVTMNRGNVSAYRENATYDVQHSAAISSGNSGGPLISNRGVVFGMNTAMITSDKANSLFYAISAKRIRKFLMNKGYENILVWGDRQLIIDKNQFTGLTKNAAGEYESPSMVIVSVNPDVTVSFNGTEIGTGQQVITLSEQINNLLLTSDEYEKELKLRLKANLEGPAVFTPIPANMLAEIEFTSEPTGRSVYADGRLMGVTPFSALLPEGRYSITAESDKKAFSEEILVISDTSSKSVHLTALDAYQIHFASFRYKDLLRLRFESTDRSYVFSELNNVFLPSDEYELTVAGVPGLEDSVIPVSVSKNSTEIDLNSYQEKIAFSIRGYIPDARLWIDGVEQPEGAGTSLELVPGVHSISIWHEKWEPLFSTKITIDPERENFIVWKKRLSAKSYRDTFFWGGIAIGSAGIITTGLGWYFGQNDLIVENTNNYSDYKSWKENADLTFRTGLITIACGLVSEFFAWRFDMKYRTKKKEFGL